MNSIEIRQRIAQVTLEHLELMQAKRDDHDLREKQEALRYAMEVYRDSAKYNQLKLEFAKLILDDKG